MAYKITTIITIFLLIFFAVVARAEELPAGYLSLSISKNIPQGGEARLDAPIGLYCGVGCAKMTNPYKSGAVVKITIITSPGYKFTGWSGNCSGSSLTCAITMNSAKNIVANFKLSSESSPNASITSASPTSPPVNTPSFAPNAVNNTAINTANVSDTNLSDTNIWKWIIFAAVLILFSVVIFVVFRVWRSRREYY